MILSVQVDCSGCSPQIEANSMVARSIYLMLTSIGLSNE